MKLVEKVLSIVIATYVIGNAVGGGLSAVAGATLTGVPANLSTLFVSLIILIVVLGIVYLVWKEVVPEGF